MAQKEKDPKEYLIKSKAYRFASLLFVTIGIFVFCILYVRNVDGRFLEAIHEPFTISIFLVPFIPAAILSMLSDRAEKKYKTMTGGK